MAVEIVALLGPTASGKSKLAIELVSELSKHDIPAEIVNSDAMQLYRHMDIGTAKASRQEREQVPHHLIDILDPSQEFTAQQYRSAFDQVVTELLSMGTLPIVVGGSMFYISAALDDLDFSPTDAQLRAKLEARVAKEGPEFLKLELASRDPESLRNIPNGNIRRLLRALEVNLLTGVQYRHALPSPEFRRPTLQLGIEVDRPALVDRIDRRVVSMWDAGLLAEVENFRKLNIELGRTASVAIGYKQAIAQIEGLLTQDEAILQTQQLTRRYARRQMSWFRRDVRTIWHREPTAAELASQIRLSL